MIVKVSVYKLIYNKTECTNIFCWSIYKQKGHASGNNGSKAFCSIMFVQNLSEGTRTEKNPVRKEEGRMMYLYLWLSA